MNGNLNVPWLVCISFSENSSNKYIENKRVRNEISKCIRNLMIIFLSNQRNQVTIFDRSKWVNHEHRAYQISHDNIEHAMILIGTANFNHSFEWWKKNQWFTPLIVMIHCQGLGYIVWSYWHVQRQLTWNNNNPSKHSHYKMCDRITHPFQNINGWSTHPCRD